MDGCPLSGRLAYLADICFLFGKMLADAEFFCIPERKAQACIVAHGKRAIADICDMMQIDNGVCI